MRVFISYRREDTQYLAGRVYDWLEREFGAEGVFKDVDSIPLGVDFRRVIQEAVSSCDVLLVLMGPGWEGQSDQFGSRLHDPSDYVRIEIETAIQRDIRIIPLIADDRRPPGAQDLPQSLHPLIYRNGMRMRPDPDFRQDMKRLTDAIRKSITPISSAKVAAGTEPITQPTTPSLEKSTSETPYDHDGRKTEEHPIHGAPVDATPGSRFVNGSVILDNHPTNENRFLSRASRWIHRILMLAAGLRRNPAWITFLVLVVCTPVSCGIHVRGERTDLVRGFEEYLFGAIGLTLCLASYSILTYAGFKPLRALGLWLVIILTTLLTFSMLAIPRL